jgi:hypothetical protein
VSSVVINGIFTPFNPWPAYSRGGLSNLLLKNGFSGGGQWGSGPVTWDFFNVSSPYEGGITIQLGDKHSTINYQGGRIDSLALYNTTSVIQDVLASSFSFHSINATGCSAQFIGCKSSTVAGLSIGVSGNDGSILNARCTACDFGTLYVEGSATTCNIDAISYPSSALTLADGATLVLRTPASAITFIPTNTGSWSGSNPSTTQAALDQLSARLTRAGW